MSEPKLISPLLDNYIMGDPISSHNGVRCCPAINKNTNERYIVKIISVPASQTQVDAMLLSGAYENKESALTYYRELAGDIDREATALQKLSQIEGFIAYEAWQIQPMEGDETGFDIYLLGTYKRTLARQLKKQSLTHLAALNLALDMCTALSACRRAGYLYADLKPDNIFFIDDQGYRIGDLGLVALSSLKYASLPDRYRSKYTAPEIADAYCSLNTTIDIYALGLILYQIFNDGNLPFRDDAEEVQEFAPPAYADYEMAEIILKACASDPEKRWQDPVEMGQAIVSYMQRNGAHDVPIVPVSAATESKPIPDTTSVADSENVVSEEAQADGVDAEVSAVDSSEQPAEDADALIDSILTADSEELTVTEDTIYTEDEQGNLTFLDNNTDDETVPNAESDDIEYDEVTDEVSEILAQADELISHETPEVNIHTEAIDVPIPDPIATDDLQVDNNSDTQTPEQEVDAIDNEDNEPAELNEETPVAEESTEPDSAEDTTEPSDDAAEEESAVGSENAVSEADDAADEAVNEDIASEQKRKKPWFIPIIIAVILLGLLAGGIYYYRNYYLQPIDSIKLEESAEGVLTVYVTSQVNESKLTVLCVDTYGNQLSAPLKNGKAVFTGLSPSSAYTVRVVTNGFHRLTGDLSVAYTTPAITNILHFRAVTGMTDGSVQLSFTPEGPDSEQWKVTYADENGEPQELTFSGHSAEISDLTIGNSYTFTLLPVDNISFTGENVVEHTAGKVIKTPKVEVTGYVDNMISVAWAEIEDVEVESWTVRCYNDAGFDKTITTSENTATIRVDDADLNYTIEVAASGMSVTVPAYAAANSLTVTDFKLDSSDSSKFTLSWYATQTPTDGWILLYTVDGGSAKEITCKAENQVTITPIIPGSTYEFSLQPADGTPVLGGNRKFTVPEADEFNGFGVTSDNMQVYMCRTPDINNWTRNDVKQYDYVTEFSRSERASFLIRLLSGKQKSDDEVVALIVVRDSSGKVITTTSVTKTWTEMWDDNYFELDIENMPESAGNYEVSLYFDGQLVHTNDFKLV